MSKAIKLQDNTYIDSSSIVHNRQKLNEMFNFSTNEVDTGYKWINGKKIYSRVIEGTISNANSTAEISASYIEDLLFVGGTCTVYGQQNRRNIPYIDGSASFQFIHFLNKKLQFKTSWANSTFRAIIFYTKS